MFRDTPSIESITHTKDGIKSIIYRFNLPGAPSIDFDVAGMSIGATMRLKVIFLRLIAYSRPNIRFIK